MSAVEKTVEPHLRLVFPPARLKLVPAGPWGSQRVRDDVVRLERIGWEAVGAAPESMETQTGAVVLAWPSLILIYTERRYARARVGARDVRLDMKRSNAALRAVVAELTGGDS